MSVMVKLPEPKTLQFSSLMSDIKDGRLKIPKFQRDFVWDIKKSAELMDSIIKGYPVGTFILWKTKERLNFIKDIGGLSLKEPCEGDYVNCVLDGQQRITSLFATLKGKTITFHSGKKEDFSKICIDLEAKDDEMAVMPERGSKDAQQIISLQNLLYADFTQLSEYNKKYHEKIAEYRKRINSYNYSIIQVDDIDISIATDIFTRINVGGKPLTLFEVMVAKTFSVEKNFDLSKKFCQLIEQLTNSNYDTLTGSTILQIISIILKGECKKQIILSLNVNSIIKIWDDVINAVKKSVDYFKSYYRIPVSRLLPYNALIVPFAYFFYNNKDKPIDKMQKYLEDFFWRVSLSGRYSFAVDSKLAQDIKRIDTILNNELPEYDWSINSSTEFIKQNGVFSTSRSYIKAILCIYAYNQPKSFDDNSDVNINNDWLKRANSKNYHHFFPKSYLKKCVTDKNANHILNITIVDEQLNKKIKDKSPSEYISDIKNNNPQLEETLKTHLISDLKDFGILSNDYDRFLNKRASVVSKEIDRRIIRQKIDKVSQPNLSDYDSDNHE